VDVSGVELRCKRRAEPWSRVQQRITEPAATRRRRAIGLIGLVDGRSRLVSPFRNFVHFARFADVKSAARLALPSQISHSEKFDNSLWLNEPVDAERPSDAVFPLPDSGRPRPQQLGLGRCAGTCQHRRLAVVAADGDIRAPDSGAAPSHGGGLRLFVPPASSWAGMARRAIPTMASKPTFSL
jgi:hypothetical protein